MLTKLFNNGFSLNEHRLIYKISASRMARHKASLAKVRSSYKKKREVYNASSGNTTSSPKSSSISSVKKKTSSRTPRRKATNVTPKASSNSVFDISNASSTYKPETTTHLNFANADKYKAPSTTSEFTFGNDLAKTISDRDKSGANKNLWSIDRFNKTATAKQKEGVDNLIDEKTGNIKGHVSNFDYGKAVGVFNKLKERSNKEEGEPFKIVPATPDKKDEIKYGDIKIGGADKYGDVKIGGTEEDVNSGDFTQKLLNGLKAGKDNPFKEGTEAYSLYNSLKGTMVANRDYATDRLTQLQDQKQTGAKLINDTANLKDEMLAKQMEDALRDQEAGVKLTRDRSMLSEMGLNEGRKRALRYLRGALAQRGAYGTTGTGKYNLSSLMSDYDVKDADLQQKANEQIAGIEKQFYDIRSKINNSKLINQSDKRKLLFELEKETNNAVNSTMSKLRDQENAVSSKAFDLGYAEKKAKEAAQAAKEKELRDYVIKRVESGENVPQDLIKQVVGGDKTYEALFGATGETGRENISSAVTGVYEAMLGSDWTTKVDPKTGATYKDEATKAVVNMVHNGTKLEDALNRVRSAIKTDPLYQVSYRAKLSSGAPKIGGSSSGIGTNIKNFKVYKDANGKEVTTATINGEPVRWDYSKGKWEIASSNDNIKNTISTGNSLFSFPSSEETPLSGGSSLPFSFKDAYYK